MRMKNLVKRSLAGALALSMVLGNTVMTNAARWETEIGVEIKGIEYQIDFSYKEYDSYEDTISDMDDSQLPSGDTFTVDEGGISVVHDMTPPAIPDKIYSGYELQDKDGNVITEYVPNPKTPSKPTLTTDATSQDVNKDGTDYTVVLFYENDGNDNDIPDPEETYFVAEYYQEQGSNNTLKAPTSQDIVGGIEYAYNGDMNTLNTLIPGYKYLGYSFKSTFNSPAGGHQGGQPTLIQEVPAFTMQSTKNVGRYDVNMFFEYDAEQWATLSYAPKGGTGTMDPQTVLKGDSVTVKANAYTNGTLEFAGWSIDDDGSVDPADAGYQAGQSFVITQDTVLYAVWEDTKSIATFHAGRENDTTVTMNKPDFTVEAAKNSTFAAPAGFETRETDPDPLYFGKHDLSLFLGWSTLPNATTPEFVVGAPIPTDFDTKDFYAVWGYFKAVPDGNTVGDTYDINDQVSYWATFTAGSGNDFVPLKDYVQTLTFLDEFVTAQPGTIKVTVNGQPVAVALTLQGTVGGRTSYTFTLPQINKGDIIKTEISAIAKKSIGADDKTLRVGHDGVTFKPATRAFRSFSANMNQNSAHRFSTEM